ncbi:MAG: serine/threonine-protein phosphatase [Flavobacteriales bacterium]|nr:serine/threonine-protein phosphatase [Flavobacteriales bacterium]
MRAFTETPETKLAQDHSSVSAISSIRTVAIRYRQWASENLEIPMLDAVTEDEKRFAKELLQWVALACMVCGVVWFAFISYHLGLCVTSFIPLSFSVLVAPFYIYNRLFDNDHYLLANVQSMAIIFVPWGIQLSLGSYASGMAVLWGILGPLCGMFFLTKRMAIRLLIIYLVNAFVAICADIQLTHDAERATESFVSNFYAMNIALPSIVVFAALYFTFSKLANQRMKVNHLLKETEIKNKNLIDSITYTKYLQKAVLPRFKKFQNRHPKSFLYFKPKDIVSGDFFWKKTVGKRIYFAVCDSTGHGVPGSMVSLICSQALETAIDTFNLTDPGVILAKTKELVVESFSHSDKPIEDGMDIGLCCLDDEIILYSGARHSLYLVRAKNNSILEIRGTRQSVGFSLTNYQFTTHVIRRRTGDRLYMTSDGLLDQFGGNENKKFKATGFKKLILDAKEMEMSEQEELFAQTMQQWIQNIDQTDDICVFGLEL